MNIIELFYRLVFYEQLTMFDALTRTVLGQALQFFSLAKLRISRLLSQKLKFWESLSCQKNSFVLAYLYATVAFDKRH
jgi:hypothetical protein